MIPENPPEEVITERPFWVKLIGEDEYKSHVWPLLRLKVYLVLEVLASKERMAWIVDMEMGVLAVTEAVKKGLPLTRKKRRFEEGRSRVRLRSL